MPNSNFSPPPPGSNSSFPVVCSKKRQTPLLHPHPLTQFFDLFPDERSAMDSAMQILAKLAIVLNEVEHENPEEVRITMQGYRNLYSSISSYHNLKF